MKTLITRYPAIKYLFFITGISLCLCACHSNEKAADDDNADVKAQTPVTVTTVDQSSLTDYIDLNATSVFQQKNYIKSNANGYIQQASALPGHFVNKGDVLFTVKTKEA